MNEPVDLANPNAASLWSRAQQLLVAGRADLSLPLFSRVVQLQPKSAAAWIQLAQVQQHTGHYRDSHETTMAAAGLSPKLPEEVVPLARLLRNLEETACLANLFDCCGWRQWRNPDALFLMARYLATTGMNAPALELLDAVSQLKPLHVNAVYLRGVIQVFEGHSAEAQRAFRECLSISPALPQAHWMMSIVRKGSVAHDEIANLRDLLWQARDKPADAAYLAYALHNRLHALERYPEAWDVLEQGWAARRRVRGYDAKYQDHLFDAIQKACNEDFMARGNAVEPRTIRDAPRVVFIVGLHRSGTSLLERMLGGHPGVCEGGESYAFPVSLKLSANHATRDVVDERLVEASPFIDYSEVGERYRRIMHWRARGRRLVTEKLPSNFLLLGYILRAMPDAIVLHMKRDPMDTCFSNLRTYFDEAAPYATDQREMAHFHGLYSRLMSHWHAVAPGRIMDVDYSKLVENPRDSMAKVLEHCGLTWDDRVIDTTRQGGAVRTASMMDARMGIQADRSGAWRNYEERVGPLLCALGYQAH